MTPPLLGTILRLTGRAEIKDNFDRTLTGALGSTSQGEYPWSILTGTWNVSGTKPTTSTSQASNPLAVVQAGSPNVDAALDVGAGDALYFRVQDASNWWRILWEGYQTQTCQTCYQTCCNTCCSTCNSIYYGCSNPGYDGGNNYKGCGGCTGTCSSLNSQWVCNSRPGDTCSYSCNCSSCNCYSCNPYNCNCVNSDNYRARLQKMVAGTLTTVADGAAAAGSTARARVVTSGASVAAYFTRSGGSSTLFYSGDQPDLAIQTRHGIGRGASNYNQSAIDNLSIKF